MPEPVALYHVAKLLWLQRGQPRHKFSSFLCVPRQSPRLTNGASEAGPKSKKSPSNASAAVFCAAPTCALSAAGSNQNKKSLYITRGGVDQNLLPQNASSRCCAVHKGCIDGRPLPAASAPGPVPTHNQPATSRPDPRLWRAVESPREPEFLERKL